jgi:prolyl 4-hydroxylase
MAPVSSAGTSSGPASSSSPARSPALRSKPVLRLVLLAVISVVALGIWLRPHGYDQHWWKRAGLQLRSKSTNAGKRVERVVYSDDGTVLEANVDHNPAHLNPDGSPVKHEDNIQILGDHDGHGLPKIPDKPPQASVFRRLLNGTDYFADYDINKIRLDPEPKIGENERRYFSYIKPEEHPEYAMRYVSNHPRVLLIQDLMTPEECDALVDMASKKLFRSQVAPVLGSKTGPVNEVRTSSQAWLNTNEEPVKTVAERILSIAGFPHGSNEMMQVLRYELDQKYDAHSDYFDPKMYGAQTSNRAITVFLYLADVEEGGETQFPRADGKPPTFDFTSCVHGLRVRPRKGQAALFYDMEPNGKLDPYSLHGGCPVKKGTKWGGTLWLRVPTGGT